MMYQYSRYNLDTGRFTGQGSNSDQANVTAKDGEGLIEGHYDHDTQMVSEGAVVDIPADTLEQEQIAKAWSDLTFNRNELLQSSDWTQVSDAPVDHAAWATYRQELRDLPENTEDPRNPVWPTRPN
tara:strand:+ start:446 stop:823 length:378 start_codon:yes stop_codon:yes gene_type:complete